jgi:hypothetical protein
MTEYKLKKYHDKFMANSKLIYILKFIDYKNKMYGGNLDEAKLKLIADFQSDINKKCIKKDKLELISLETLEEINRVRMVIDNKKVITHMTNLFIKDNTYKYHLYTDIGELMVLIMSEIIKLVQGKLLDDHIIKKLKNGSIVLLNNKEHKLFNIEIEDILKLYNNFMFTLYFLNEKDILNNSIDLSIQAIKNLLSNYVNYLEKINVIHTDLMEQIKSITDENNIVDIDKFIQTKGVSRYLKGLLKELLRNKTDVETEQPNFNFLIQLHTELIKRFENKEEINKLIEENNEKISEVITKSLSTFKEKYFINYGENLTDEYIKNIKAIISTIPYNVDDDGFDIALFRDVDYGRENEENIISLLKDEEKDYDTIMFTNVTTPIKITHGSDISGVKGEFDIIIGVFDDESKKYNIKEIYEIKTNPDLIPKDLIKFYNAVRSLQENSTIRMENKQKDYISYDPDMGAESNQSIQKSYIYSLSPINQIILLIKEVYLKKYIKHLKKQISNPTDDNKRLLLELIKLFEVRKKEDNTTEIIIIPSNSEGFYGYIIEDVRKKIEEHKLNLADLDFDLNENFHFYECPNPKLL